MKILIDADACPVCKIILRIGESYGLQVIQVTDTSHELHGAQVITVDKGSDSADLRIANLTRPGDLVVTQDYGLAALTLGKGAFAIDQNGREYTNGNMDQLLFERALSKKIRQSGGRTGTIKKRTYKDDRRFEEALRMFLDHHI